MEIMSLYPMSYPNYATVNIYPIRKKKGMSLGKSKWLKNRIKRRRKEKAGVRRADNFKTQLIEKATLAELRLKDLLTKNKIFFQFQYVVISEKKTAIIDFCLPRKNMPKLFIEIDGEYHNTTLQKNIDEERSQWLLEYTDCEIIRFTNAEVLQDSERVLRDIMGKSVWIKSVVGKC